MHTVFLGFLGFWWNIRSPYCNSSDAKTWLALVASIIKFAFSYFYYIKHGKFEPNVLNKYLNGLFEEYCL